MNHLVSVLRLLAIVFGFEILVILMLASGPSLLAENKLDDPAEIVTSALSTAHQDTTQSPTPSPLVAQPSLPPVDGHMEGGFYGWSGFENTHSYHVVDQCLCPQDLMVSTKSIVNNNHAMDDCSFSSDNVTRNSNIH
jgi:hypothetical protein